MAFIFPLSDRDMAVSLLHRSSEREEKTESNVANGTEIRRTLVRRICASTAFQKSPQLAKFLKYVYRRSEEGRAAELNEQHLGVALFERRSGYDPGDDSIVRSHASRLRRKLEEYFEQQGALEPLRIVIPRGSYAPCFFSAPAPPQQENPLPAAISTTALAPESAPSLPAIDSQAAELTAGQLLRAERSARLYRRLSLCLLAALVLCSLLICYQRWQSAMRSPLHAIAHHPLWSRLIDPHRGTIVVAADSGAVLLQNLTLRPIDLGSYTSGAYLHTGRTAQFSEQALASMGSRHYTSMVDLKIFRHLDAMLGDRTDLLEMRYARELQIDELKHGNAILLGTYESTPWVQLYEQKMNFYFQNDLAHGVFSIVNRAPRTGENARYDSAVADPRHTVYGVVAFQPALDKTGHVLILEGQSMSGTQTASDFVFNDALLLPFLDRIRTPDGDIPPFELLLRSHNIASASSQIDIVTYRVDGK